MFSEQRARDCGDQQWLERADERCDPGRDAVVDAGEDQPEIDELREYGHPHVGHEILAGDRGPACQQDEGRQAAGNQVAPAEQIKG